jgi:ATP-dependent DNA helicase DinG
MSDLDFESVLGPGGSISRRISNYEHRHEQLQMALAVTQALEKRKHLIVEAGTGVGKSFGYLVPAILFATSDEANLEKTQPSDNPNEDPKTRRIVISTHTISLQEQLIAKDLPLLNAVIPREFTSVLVKGRSNYISLRRMQVARSRLGSLLHDERDFENFKEIEQWSESTSDGSLSSLSFRPSGLLWDELSSDSGNCMGRLCKSFDKCFYYAARRRVANAKILVVNHALFFSDLAVRAQGGSFLPNYDAVIFDECHTMENVAGDHLGLTVSNSQVDYTLRKLYNPRNDKGTLVALGLRQLQKLSYGCMESLDAFVDDFVEWAASDAPANGRLRTPVPVKTDLPQGLKELAAELERYGKDIKDANNKLDMMSAANRLSVLGNSLETWLTQKETDTVYWFEKKETRGSSRNFVRLTLRSSPLDIGNYLREHLFQKVPSVIMASATIATKQSENIQQTQIKKDDPAFHFFQRRIGALGVPSLQVGSPFDYPKLAELHMLTDLPDPSLEKNRYEDAIIPALKHYIQKFDGHAFVLFTSYESLRRTSQALASWMAQQNLATYSQADGMPRTELLQAFKDHPRGVLFGAESFWQGVDVPGDALKLVVITKLPFSVPDHPLLEARLEAIRKGGGNPFRDFQLPEAVIKFRQGFGRLIRTASDSGVVLVTDPRMSTKPYGATFASSLPACPKKTISAKQFLV